MNETEITTKTIRAILYARVSTGNQADTGTSLPEQFVLCRRKVEELGGQVIAEYADPGVSGALYLSRPGIQAALRDIEQGKANTLVIAKLDRTGRDVDVIRAIGKRVQAAGARLIFADGMNFENNATGKLMFTQLAGFAEFEKELIRERTMAGRASRAREGIQPYRSRSPFGYYVPTKEDVLKGMFPAGSDGRYVIVEDQAQIVRDIYSEYASGASLREVSRSLLKRGTASPRGGAFWQPISIKHLLENPVYMGKPAVGRHSFRPVERQDERGARKGVSVRRTDPSQWITLSCDAIVDEHTWRLCNERLKENRALLGGNFKHKYLFSGLLRCPTCRRPMVAHGRTDGRRGGMYYHCRFYSPSQHPLGESCTPTCHAGTKAEPIILSGAYDTASRPEAIEIAVREYRAEETDVMTATDRKRTQSALDALDNKERAIASAQVDAISKGRDTAVYDSMLADLSKKRATLRSQLTESKENERTMPDPNTAGQIAKEYLADLMEVITSETLQPFEKRAALARVIKEIIPEGDNYRIYWRPFCRGDSTVSNISTFGCLAHCIRLGVGS